MQQLAGVREFIRWVVRELPYLFPSEWLMFGVVAIQHNVAGKLDIMMIV
jgi:hypothetical protein